MIIKHLICKLSLLNFLLFLIHYGLLWAIFTQFTSISFSQICLSLHSYLTKVLTALSSPFSLFFQDVLWLCLFSGTLLISTIFFLKVNLSCISPSLIPTIFKSVCTFWIHTYVGFSFESEYFVSKSLQLNSPDMSIKS